MGRVSGLGCGWVLALALAATARAEPADGPVETAKGVGAPSLSRPAPTPSATLKRVEPAPAATASGDATDRQIAGWIADDRVADRVAGTAAPGGLDEFGGDPASPAPRRIRGEVGVGFGSSGYREAYGAVAVPVGRAGEVDLVVGDAHANFRRRGGVERRSVALGVVLDGRDVAGALSHDKCNVPRWGVGEKTDPVVDADGSCAPRTDAARR